MKKYLEMNANHPFYISEDEILYIAVDDIMALSKDKCSMFSIYQDVNGIWKSYCFNSIKTYTKQEEYVWLRVLR